MKLLYIIILILSIGIIISGCSPTPSEFIHVGAPVEGGVYFSEPITNEEKIEEVRDIFSDLKNTDKPDSPIKKADADIVIKLRTQGGAISEISEYVWYVEDGNSIIKDLNDNYKVIPKEKTDRLKALILDAGINLNSLVPSLDTDDSNSE